MEWRIKVKVKTGWGEVTEVEIAMTCTPDWYRSEVESFALMGDG